MRLKKWVKVVLSAILLILAVTVWLKVGKWGELAQNSRIYENLTICGWIWLILQPFAISSIWGN